MSTLSRKFGNIVTTAALAAVPLVAVTTVSTPASAAEHCRYTSVVNETGRTGHGIERSGWIPVRSGPASYCSLTWVRDSKKLAYWCWVLEDDGYWTYLRVSGTSLRGFVRNSAISPRMTLSSAPHAECPAHRG